jgi:tetratricopeptide (TPR) repeat protein
MKTKCRINGVFVLISFVACAVAGVGLYVLHEFQLGRSTRLVLKQAIEAEEAGELDESRRLYQNYLGQEPKGADALRRYGLLLARTAKTARDRINAFFALERALRANPEQEELRRKIIDVAMSPELPTGDRRYNDAKFHLLTLLKETPNKAELEDLLGQCLEAMGQLQRGVRRTTEAQPSDPEMEQAALAQDSIGPEDRLKDDERYPGALAAYQLAIEHDPSRISAYVNLARVHERLERRADAEHVMDARDTEDGIVARNPESPLAYLRRSFYRREHRIPGADDDLAKALELGPKETEVLFEAIAQALAAKRQEDTGALIERVKVLLPNDHRVFLAMAQLDQLAGRKDETVSNLGRSVEAAATEPAETALSLRWALADTLIQQGRLDDAVAAIAKLRSDGLPGGLLSYLEGRLHMARRQWAEALAKLRNARPQFVESSQLHYDIALLLARCYAELGDTEGRLAAFRSAVDSDGSKVPGRLGLAASLAESGRNDQAIDIYRSLSGQVPGMKLAIARLRLVETLEREERLRQWDTVDQALAEAEKEDAGSAELLALRIRALQSRGNTRDIDALLTKVLAEHTDNSELQAVALNALVGADPKSALDKLQRLDSSTRAHAAFRLALIRNWASLGGAPAVEALEKLELGVDEFPEATRQALRLALCTAFVQVGRADTAQRILDSLVKTHPDNFRLAVMQYDLALASKDQARAAAVVPALKVRLQDTAALDFRALLRLYDIVIDRSGDAELVAKVIDAVEATEGAEGAHWRVAKARRTLTTLPAARSGSPPESRAQIEQARRWLEEAALRRPRWAVVPVIQGILEERAGNPAGAIEAYEKAKSYGSRTPEVFLGLFRVYASLGRMQQADSQIAEMNSLGLKSEASTVARLAVEGQLRQGVDPAKVVEQARAAVGTNSNSSSDLLWLGRILATAGQSGEAETVLRRSVEVDAKSAGSWIALMQVLVQQGRRDDASAILSNAQTQVSPEVRHIVLAQGYGFLGEQDKAYEQFDQAIQANPSDSSLIRNAAWYCLLTGQRDLAEKHLRRLLGTRGAPAADLRWARFTLAPLLASAGSSDRRSEARSLLNLGDDPRTVRLTGDLSADEIRARAHVMSLEPTRAWQQMAITSLERLVNRNPAAAASDQFLLSQLYERKGDDWQRARDLIVRVLDGDGNNPTYIEQYLRWLLIPGAGRPQRDPVNARMWVERLKRLDPNSARTAELEARYLAARDQADQAVKLLSDHAAQHPSELPRIASCVEQIGKPAQAETLFRTLVELKPSDPGAILLMAGFLERQGESRAQDAEAYFKQFLEVNREQRPDSGLVMAQYYGRHGRLDEALALCEQALSTSTRPALVGDVLIIALSEVKPTPGQLARAARLLEAAQVKAPEDPAIQFQLGNLYSQSERFDLAVQQFEKCKNSAPDHAATWNNLAFLLALTDSSRLSDALELAEEAISRFGETPELRDTRAVIYLQLDRAPDAARDLKSLVDSSFSPRPIWLLHLAQAQHKTGRTDQARDSLRRAYQAGLDESTLSALERPAFENLRRALGPL